MYRANKREENQRSNAEVNPSISSAERWEDQPLPVEDYLTLTQASAVTPGRPSPSAMWRWARKGVKARTGERILMRHVRAGGRVFVTRAWILDFVEALASRDSEYFSAKDQAAAGAPPRSQAFASPTRPRKPRRPKAPFDPDRQKRVAAELEGEGL